MTDPLDSIRADLRIIADHVAREIRTSKFTLHGEVWQRVDDDTDATLESVYVDMRRHDDDAGPDGWDILRAAHDAAEALGHRVGDTPPFSRVVQCVTARPGEATNHERLLGFQRLTRAMNARRQVSQHR